jgi:hypothetical protein
VTIWAHYWKRERVEDGEGTFVGHSASSVFRQRGVKAGDRMYVVSVLGGQLRVIGRLDVEDVVTQQRADDLFGRHVWEGTDHVVARPGSGTQRRLDAFLPASRIGEFEVVGANGEVMPVKLNRLDQVDVLSLQGLREITARTATLFDHVLGLKPDMDIAVKGADSI